ncbi:hypothetical protein OG2516_12136 [Oceanicola granulosus HTCC2516]|uniref:YdhG-like domain-containing protein n=1 Tax=Oceanicola granulosus (strain ATCC BAA-861 / DSM 15982 / KCTC 12143 / HTCC2516) TaxID=314256 RepID=Q2CD81_OCEGH|nr:YdeI/OmpD-associated family protein [Oceanicola granulosus]EAR50597.1 hypothetical protein OG2516_12136 [Oceanicola granulosus HTCC2516]
MTNKVDEWYAKDRPWRAELLKLREVLKTTGLGEAFKWNGPCYTGGGGNICAVWSMKENCALAFFKGALLTDSEGVLAAPGANSRSMRTMRFTSVAQIEARADTIRAYAAEAIALEAAGAKVTFDADDLEPPGELTEALEDDPDLREAFDALTPGRRRGWMLHFAGAKQAATRARRVEKARPLILAGKGYNER